MAGTCECGNEPSGCIQCGEFTACFLLHRASVLHVNVNDDDDNKNNNNNNNKF